MVRIFFDDVAEEALMARHDQITILVKVSNPMMDALKASPIVPIDWTQDEPTLHGVDILLDPALDVAPFGSEDMWAFVYGGQ
jgi:hypothetical protein